MRKLKVWWIPQMPMKSFEVEVRTLREARLLVTVLADYDIFQFENKIKPDYANVGGVVEFENEEWIDWCDPDTGEDFDEVTDERLDQLDNRLLWH